MVPVVAQAAVTVHRSITAFVTGLSLTSDAAEQFACCKDVHSNEDE